MVGKFLTTLGWPVSNGLCPDSTWAGHRHALALGVPMVRAKVLVGAYSTRVRWVDANAFYYDQALPTLGFQSTELDLQDSVHTL